MSAEAAGRTDERLLVLPPPEIASSTPTSTAESGVSHKRSSSTADPSASGQAIAAQFGLRSGAIAAISTEAARGTGFLFLPVFMAAGALTYFVQDYPIAAALTVVVLAALAAATVFARQRPALLALLLVAASFHAGVVAADFETRRSATEITGSPVATAVTGRVVRIEHRADGRVRLTLDVLATARPTLRYSPERVRLTARSVPDELTPGEVLNGYARLMPPSGPVRPGGYDFAFESWFDGIGAIGFFLGNPERVEWQAERTRQEWLADRVEAARLAIATRVRERMGGDEGEIAAALIAGVRGGIPDEINEALRRTGLAHVLSISGLHMALVALTVMLALRLGFALFPDFASRHPTKKYGAALALLACLVYLVISGAAVAAQRSFIMLAVMLLALLCDRAALTMRNLAIAALIVIAISPHEVMGPSFQMSFGATAALIGGYAAWSQHRARQPRRRLQQGVAASLSRRVVYGIYGLAMTSIIAGLATTIYGVYHFHRVSPYALGANLLAMPVVSFLVMPWAVAGGLLMPIGLDWLPLAVMGKGLELVIGIATWFSQRSPIDAVGLMSPASVIAFTLALVAATLPTTWLRLTALPIAAIAFGLVWTRTLPDVLVSEDGRLMAVVTTDGLLAVNRARPNAFTIENWTMATAAAGWQQPARAGTAGGTERTAPVFVCEAQTCVATTAGGARVVHTASESEALVQCGSAAVIVIDDATARNPCTNNPGPVVLTKRDLALRGSAAVYFTAADGGATVVARTQQAIRQPPRPWHAHRKFSREARGLPPNEPRQAARSATND